MIGTESILSSTEFQMSLLMFVALGGYLIAYRLHQPAIVGIILAGVLVGPSLLHLVTYTDYVRTLAQLGAVVLLFTIGLEFSMKDIVKIRYFWIALWGVLIPAFGGFLLAEAFGFEFKSSVFVGTALTATSIAVTAHVLKEMGKLQTDAAKAIIGAAVIDDVIAASCSFGVPRPGFGRTVVSTNSPDCWESCRLCGAWESGGQNGGQRRDGEVGQD